MLEETKKEKTQNSSLMGTLSVLGVLAIALTAGLLFMQKKSGSNEPLSLTQLLEKQDEAPEQSAPISWAKKGSPYPSSTDAQTGAPATPDAEKEFDPISWAREGRSYPPLREEKSPGTGDTEFVANYSTRDAIPREPETKSPASSASGSPVTSSARKLPVKESAKGTAAVKSVTGKSAGNKNITAAPAAAVVLGTSKNNTTAKSSAVASSAYQKIKENAYWVQVFSSDDASRAEVIRDELAKIGLPAMIQTKKIDGHMWYRVRIGAFSQKNEAENYAETVRDIRGYAASFVVLAPVTRQVSYDG